MRILQCHCVDLLGKDDHQYGIVTMLSKVICHIVIISAVLLNVAICFA